LVQLAEEPLPEDVGEADDRVQRGPQLVAHVREELTLVPAGRGKIAVRLLELSGFRLYLGDQPNVLDGDDRLVREDLDELDLLDAERPHLLAAQEERADPTAVPDQWRSHRGALVQ